MALNCKKNVPKDRPVVKIVAEVTYRQAVMCDIVEQARHSLSFFQVDQNMNLILIELVKQKKVVAVVHQSLELILILEVYK